MRKFAFILVTAMATFGRSPAAFASLLGNYPLPKSVCERTHKDVIQSLSANPTQFVSDQLYARLSERFDEIGTAPESKRESLLKSGHYSFMASTEDEIIPRFQMGVGSSSGGFGAGGFGTGLCWWHSRFHRAAAYLVDFVPGEKAPTSQQAKKIFRQLTKFLPVVIPGFDSLYEFTRSFPSELESVLTEWELRTTVVTPQHILRPTFATLFSSEQEKKNLVLRNLKGLLNELHTNPRPIFLMLDKAHRIGLHSFLIIGYRMDSEGSIILKYLDSESEGKSREWKTYSNGRLNLRSPSFEAIDSFEMIHTDFDSDFEKIQAGLRKKCGANYMLR